MWKVLSLNLPTYYWSLLYPLVHSIVSEHLEHQLEMIQGVCDDMIDRVLRGRKQWACYKFQM